MRSLLVLAAAGTLLSGATPSHTVTVVADRDATLIEASDGALANGAGPLFAGRTNQIEASRRRAVLHFDLRDALPRDAVVESVALTLYRTPSNPGGTLELHRLLANWNEGPTYSGGGGGGPVRPGDVTWIHTLYPDEVWVRPGGQFVARASGAAASSDEGPLTWTDAVGMVADVRLWQHAPDRNFGWEMIGNETMPQTSQSFASREDADPDKRPRLTIVYRRPGHW
jgi:hypothetical protein